MILSILKLIDDFKILHIRYYKNFIFYWVLIFTIIFHKFLKKWKYRCEISIFGVIDKFNQKISIKDN